MAAAVTMTQRTYYQNTYLETLETRVVETGSDETGSFFIPAETIFHPKGGGQPSDKGNMMIGDTTIPVIALAEDKERGAIKHYFNAQDRTMELRDMPVTLTVDMVSRRLFARLHSAGHLIANIVEEFNSPLEGYKGHHFPGGEAYVVFKGASMPDKDKVLDILKEQVPKAVSEDAIVTVNNESSPRTVQFGTRKVYPCGGTHVQRVGEIGDVTIRKVSITKGELKVGYDVK